MSLITELSRQTLFESSSRFFGERKDFGTGSDIFVQQGTIASKSRQAFRFDAGGNLSVVLSGQKNSELKGNLELQVFDAAGLEVSRSTQPNRKDETISLANLNSDTYFIVITNDTEESIPYESEASNNTISELISAEKGINFNSVTGGRVSDRDTSDFLNFSLNQKTNLKVVLDEPQYLSTLRGQNADVRLIRDLNNDRLVQFSEVLTPSTSDFSDTNSNRRVFTFNNLDVGKYYVQAFSDGDATRYELTISPTNSPNIASSFSTVYEAENLAFVPFDATFSAAASNISTTNFGGEAIVAELDLSSLNSSVVIRSEDSQVMSSFSVANSASSTLLEGLSAVKFEASEFDISELLV
jgi:uncharacterized protein (DUF2141 family)